MAFIIPNAVDTADGQRFANTNQAEPDSLDIEALGNMLTACVRSGGEVTYSGSGNTINIAAGVAIFGGVPYSFNASSFAYSAVTDVAFTAVVVRLTAGVAAVTTLNGAASSTNPTLPKSASTLTGSYNAATDYNPATDVVLASVLRTSTPTPTSRHIVDKRVMFTGTLHWTQATGPTVNQGINGDLVTVGTVVYVKAAGLWHALTTQSVVDEIMPVGGIMTWPSLKSPTGIGSRWLECNGQSVTATNFPALANAWGVSGTFAIPNYNGLMLQGTTVSGSGIITTTGGAATATVPLRNHTHTLNNHTHTMSAHSHTATVTGTDGGHSHTGSLSNTAVTVNTGGSHNHTVLSRTPYIPVQGDAEEVALFAHVRLPAGSTGGGYSLAVSNTTLNGTVPSNERLELIRIGGSSGMTAYSVGTNAVISLNSDHGHTAAVTNGAVAVSGAGNHSHAITVSTAPESASGGPSVANTSEVGDGAAPSINTVPPFRAVRYFVRAA